MDIKEILSDPSVEGRLELRNDGGGPRHYLHGRRVDPGDMLEIAIKNHCYLRARYEGTWRLGNLAAGFTIDLGGLQVATIILPNTAAVCWPQGPTPPRYDVWDPWDLDDDEDQAAGGLVADDVDADRRQAELDRRAERGREADSALRFAATGG